MYPQEISEVSQAFQPTPPSREATYREVQWRGALLISTHASLAGGDKISRQQEHYHVISTHASLAGGDNTMVNDVNDFLISTHASLAGGDVERITLTNFMEISTHASLAGGDLITS